MSLLYLGNCFLVKKDLADAGEKELLHLHEMNAYERRMHPAFICKQMPLLYIESGVAPANQTKERSVHELFARACRNKNSM